MNFSPHDFPEALRSGDLFPNLYFNYYDEEKLGAQHASFKVDRNIFILQLIAASSKLRSSYLIRAAMKKVSLA